MRKKFDIVIATDLRLPGGSSSSTVEEIKAQAQAGYSTGLLHVTNPVIKQGRPFNEKVTECLRNKSAELIGPDDGFDTKLLIIRSPKVLDNFHLTQEQFSANHCLLVANHVAADDNGVYYDVLEIDALARKTFTSYEWAPIGPLVRAPIDIHKDRVPVRAKDWVNVIDISQWRHTRNKPVGVKPVIGRVSRDHYVKWPATSEDILTVYPESEDIAINILGGAEVPKSILGNLPQNWRVYPYGTFAAQNFLKEIDFFVYYHHPGLTEAFGRAALEGMASGAIAILPKHFEPLFKDAALYAEPEDVIPLVHKYHDNWALYKEQSLQGVQFVNDNFSYEAHRTRVAEIIGKPSKSEHTTKTNTPKKYGSKEVVMFMSSNGVGVGHLTRLMAMARQSSKNIQPIFFTLSQAVEVVEKSGFPVEYLASSSYLGVTDYSIWHDLLEQRLNSLYRTYKPSVIVFDGTMPFKGLLRFLESHPNIKSVWSRRAMWKDNNSITAQSLPDISKKFNLVIEPGEVSESIDDGPTVPERKNAFLVNPITYLDKTDLLSKKEARKKLGLHPTKTIGLIQLGAGNINDTSSILGNILKVYKDKPNLQLCVTKSIIANHANDANYKNVTPISHYPLSECFNAFDFAIGAAGYNTFHEFINFGVPSLIIPNTHAKTDDALNRIKVPDDSGAILVAHENDIESIRSKALELLNPLTRQSLRENLKKLHRPNGAKDAMRKIESLLKKGDQK